MGVNKKNTATEKACFIKFNAIFSQINVISKLGGKYDHGRQIEKSGKYFQTCQNVMGIARTIIII